MLQQFYLVASLTVCLFNLIHSSPLIKNDPCLRAECGFGEICQRSIDGLSFNCIREQFGPSSLPSRPFQSQQLKKDLFSNYPTDYFKQYLNFNPCLSSPCSFKQVCRYLENESSYVCVKELEAPSDVEAARAIAAGTIVHQNMESKYSQAIYQNIENHQYGVPPNIKFLRPKEFVTRLSAKNSSRNACLSNPCQSGMICRITPDQVGYKCVEKPKEEELNNNKELDNYRSESTTTTEAEDEYDDICLHSGFKQKIAHPSDHKRFYLCLNDTEYLVLNCKENLVFNKHLNKCWDNIDPISTDCSTNPCLYGGECVTLDNDQFKCNCPAGFSGALCEETHDPCASNPCGDDGTCQTIERNRYLSYYCTCDENNSFGLDCDQNKDMNPCIDQEEAGPFQTKFHPLVYVTCNKEDFEFVRCNKSEKNNECTYLPLVF